MGRDEGGLQPSKWDRGALPRQTAGTPPRCSGTEILRWSDRRERADALLQPCRSSVTLPATKRTEIVEQGRPASGSHLSAHSARPTSYRRPRRRSGRVARRASGPAPIEVSSKELGRKLTRRARMSEKCSAACHVLDRQPPMCCWIFSNRQSDGPPLRSCFCRIRTASRKRDW
jgi:hypothetical protein